MSFDFSTCMAWVGGLFEGEGSFSERRKPSGYCSPAASINLTDVDTLLLFAERVPVGRTYGPYERHSSDGRAWQPQYVWQTSGFEDTQAFIAMVWPWLGERRRARAREVLAAVSPMNRIRRRDQNGGR